MANWNDVLGYLTDHALVIGISGALGLIGTTLGSITAHHIRKLRKKSAPKVYLSKVEKLELKAQRLRNKKVAKTIGKFDSRTSAVFITSALNILGKNGYTIQDPEKNIVTNNEAVGLAVTGKQETTVLKLG